MTITAKYPGTCPACNGSIRRGDRIEWTRGQKPTHSTCNATTETKAAEPRIDGPCWTCKAPGRFRSHGAAAPVLCDSCHSTCKDCPRRCEHCGHRTEKDWQRDRQRCVNCCPTCHGPLPRAYALQGYQCDGCADAEEFGA